MTTRVSYHQNGGTMEGGVEQNRSVLLTDHVQRDSMPGVFRCIVHCFDDSADDGADEVRSSLESYFDVRGCQKADRNRFPHSSCFNLILQPKPKVQNGKLGSEWLQRNWSTVTRTNDLWLEPVRPPPREKVLKKSKHVLTLSQLTLGALTSAGVYQCHWSSEVIVTSDVTRRNARSSADGSDDTDDDDDDVCLFDDDDDDAIGESPLTMSDDDEDDKIPEAPLTMSVEFDEDSEQIDIRWIESENVHWRMETTISGLADRVVLAQYQPKDGVYHLYFFVANQPKVYRGAPQSRSRIIDIIDDDAPEPETVWERDVCFGTCPRRILGASNVLHVRIDESSSDKSVIDDLLCRLGCQGFTVCFANPETRRWRATTGGDDEVDCVLPPVASWPKFSSFDATYAWYCLLTKGFKVTDQLTDQVYLLLRNHVDDNNIARVLNAVGNRFDDSAICRVSEVLIEEIGHRDEGPEDPIDDEPEIAHMVKVRRLLLTPSTVRGLPAEYIVGNRVVREYGTERFLRVVLRDEDLELLTASAGRMSEPVEVIVDFLGRDLTIGDRRYHFLGCSNSQLREHGFWMYASDGIPGHTVDEIRRWMGDLSHERCVATYVSRLGQFFSSSKKTVTVDDVQVVPDVTSNGYCFTDGIGKLSTSLANRVCQSLSIKQKPSAFQIRYGGCKGVVAVDPRLEGEMMIVRKSMEKFRSEHKELEVVNHTSAGSLFLNRQVIVLLSGLGVPDKSFFDLQDVMLQRLADMLVKERPAAEALSQVGLGLTRQMLLNSRIALTQEPFLRSVLRTVYENKLNELIKKTRIEIRKDKGRIMMGTVDETGSLSYGQVFVQYSTDTDHPGVKPRVLTGPVVIAKNPCFHPGDVRKFDAVDAESLSHMIDCVVFPAVGDRPHPNEMSGSDLDGDMYFVCWDESLLPPGNNREPMNYEGKEKQVLDHPVTEKDMVEFIGNYIEGDKLGVIANAHLAHADGQKDGIFSTQCLQLAQMHSDAVDFPKTGCSVTIPFELRPQSYPHYMMKRDKPIYNSKHVLGGLFDKCRAVESLKRHRIPEADGPDIDRAFLVRGYEDYLDTARRLANFYRRHVSRLMTEYGIATEAEVVTGKIVKLKNVRRGTIKREHVEMAQLIRCQMQWVKNKVKTMFFSEFDDAPVESNAATADSDYEEQRKLKICRKLSALYFIAYSDNQPHNGTTTTCLGLPWIFPELLVSLRNIGVDERLPVSVTSVLDRMSEDIDGLRPTTALATSRRNRSEALTQLRRFVAQQPEISAARLVVFGSTATSFDCAASTLDLLVHVQPGDGAQTMTAAENVVRIIAGGFTSVKEVTKKTASRNDKLPLAVVIGSVKIFLHAAVEHVERTVFVLAMCARNHWIVPVLSVVVAWATKVGIAGGSRNSYMTTEQLVLLFLSFVQRQSCRRCDGLDVSDVARTKMLLVEGHFESCDVSACSHIFCEETGVSGGVAGDNEEDRQLTAEVLLQFLHHYCRVDGAIISEAVDPSSSKPVLVLKDTQRRAVADRLLKAYHLLAQSGSIHALLDVPRIADGHLMMDLPRQLSARILFVESIFAEMLKTASKARVVTIKRKRYRDAMAGLVLEAWGDSGTLEFIEDRIKDEIRTSLLFVKGSRPFPSQIAPEAYVVIFEGSHGEASLVRTMPYYGPHQPNHDRFICQVPRLLDPDLSSTYDLDKFIGTTMRQLQLISSKYDRRLHGEIRAVISYGTLYMTSPDGEELVLTETAMDEIASERKTRGALNEDGLVGADPVSRRSRSRRGGRRGRGAQAWNGERPGVSKPRFTFIPSGNRHFDALALETFLGDLGFTLTDHFTEIRPSLKVRIDGHQTSADALVILDENFVLKETWLPDVKWVCANVVSADNDENLRHDFRFKLHSRIRLSPLELSQRYPDFADVVAGHRRMLCRVGDRIVGVHPDFRTRIRFMRKKVTSEFRLAANRQSPGVDDFLYGMSIRVDRGDEYSRPNADGVFENVDFGRTEVTIIPECPDFQNAEIMETFLRKSWHFAREVSSMLTRLAIQ